MVKLLLFISLQMFNLQTRCSCKFNYNKYYIKKRTAVFLLTVLTNLIIGSGCFNTSMLNSNNKNTFSIVH